MVSIDQLFEEVRNLLSVNCPMVFHLLVRIFTQATKQVDTAAMSVHNGRIELLYNEEFLAKLTKAERSFVLVHEVMHLMLHHCTLRTSHDRARHYIENVAMDLAINTLIREDDYIKLPRAKEDSEFAKKDEITALVPEQFGFPPMLSYEQYLDLLEQKFPPKKIAFVFKDKDGNIIGGADGDPEDADIVVEIDPNCDLGKITYGKISPKHGEQYSEDPFVDDFIRNEIENITRNKLWGNTPGDVVENILKAQIQPLDWGDILHLELGHFISFDKIPSRRRWNKHFGKPFLGVTTKSVEPVGVYVDTSGSVGNADLSRFIVEIERIAHYTTVLMWSFDTQIYDPEEAIVFSRRDISSIEFKGRGGTCFKPIFEHAKKHEIHKVVVLTDGYADEIPASDIEGMEVIWAITPGGNLEGKAGTVIEMKR